MTNPDLQFTPMELTDLDKRIMAAKFGEYPWDDWQAEALASGLEPELAGLGRLVMREAYNHGWCERLQRECGLDNPATAKVMIARAQEQPYLMTDRWEWLLASDGLRFDPWKYELWPEDAPEWNEMRRRWEAEVTRENSVPPEALLQREACRYIADFYDLDQLAIIGLPRHGISRAKGNMTFWADFMVSVDEPCKHFAHSGIVRITIDDATSTREEAVFERVEE